MTQQSAVDLLAAGKNDTETAELLKINRVSVTRWRLYSPEFRAALAVRRADIWGAAANRLRALVPKAIDALAAALDEADESDRLTVALAVLKLAGPLPLAPTEPTDPAEYVREVVKRERENVPSELDRLIESGKDLPAYNDHLDTVRKRLALMSPADEPVPPTSPEPQKGDT